MEISTPEHNPSVKGNRALPFPSPCPAQIRFARTVLMGVVALALFLVGGCGKESQASSSEQLYTCGMHPQVVQNKPGNCPICGMKLTPIRKQPGAGMTNATSAAASTITIDPA